MTRAEAEELVRPYVGKVIEEIGTHIPDKSVYNYNFYRLPNGTVVLLQSNDDCFSEVAVVAGDIEGGNKIWVGGQQDDGYGLMLGEFT